MAIIFEDVEAQISASRSESASAPQAAPAPAEPSRESLLAELAVITERRQRLCAD